MTPYDVHRIRISSASSVVNGTLTNKLEEAKKSTNRFIIHQMISTAGYQFNPPLRVTQSNAKWEFPFPASQKGRLPETCSNFQ